MWLCVLLDIRSEETHENAQWRKVLQMQPVWPCLLWSKNIEITSKTHTREKSNKCNQCDYVSSQTSNLKTHLKTHIGEKSKKCSQYDYASSHAGHLRTHLKIHSREKSNKCNQCDYASSQISNLRRHLKTHSKWIDVTASPHQSFSDFHSSHATAEHIHVPRHPFLKIGHL